MVQAKVILRALEMNLGNVIDVKQLEIMLKGGQTRKGENPKLNMVRCIWRVHVKSHILLSTYR
jgi:hypothetical protein